MRKINKETESAGKEDIIMDRKQINDLDTEKVIGGSFIFNEAHTTCGRKNNHEYKVNDYDAVVAYIKANYMNMSEKDMANKMLASGLLEKLE